MSRLLALLGLLFPAPVLAGADTGTCDTAIVFAIDVSNSVVPSEYALQVEGLAAALRDPEVSAAMLRGQVAVAVLQWSGENSQRVSVPWRRIEEPADLMSLAATVLGIERAFELSDTAPAEAIRLGLGLLAEAPDCGRHVIDVSGDGKRNAGGDVAAARAEAEAAGVTVNGIAIELIGSGIAQYYREELVTRDGFVMTARGHADYPRALREKILRELGAPTV